MRPITKIAPTSAQYPGPANYGVNLGNPIVTFLINSGVVHSTTPTSITFAQYNAGLVKIQNRLVMRKGNNPTTSEAGDLKVDLTTKSGGVFALSSIYGTARLHLISNLGAFCSFCEMPVGDSNLAVEHMIPKDKFLIEATDYDNFLLCCPTCNSCKEEFPCTDNYSIPIGWADTAIPPCPAGTLPLSTRTLNKFPSTVGSYQQLTSVLRNAYMWPIYPGAYRNFHHEIQSNPNSLPLTHTPAQKTTWLAGFVPVTAAPDPANDRITAVQDGQVTAIVGGGTTAEIVRVRVSGVGGTIAANSVPAPNPAAVAGYPSAGAAPNSHAMVEKRNSTTGDGMLNLNKMDIDWSFSDRRVVNRTKAWFAALSAFNRLNIAQGVTGAASAAYQLMLQEVCSTAGAMGFFSTWVRAFDGQAPATPGPTGPIPGGAPPGPPPPPNVVPNATVDFVMRSTGNVTPAPAVVEFPGTNIANTIP